MSGMMRDDILMLIPLSDVFECLITIYGASPDDTTVTTSSSRASRMMYCTIMFGRWYMFVTAECSCWVLRVQCMMMSGGVDVNVVESSSSSGWNDFSLEYCNIIPGGATGYGDESDSMSVAEFQFLISCSTCLVHYELQLKIVWYITRFIYEEVV